MEKTRLVVCVLIMGMAAYGCGDVSAPFDDFEPPEPDLSLDPDRLSVGEYIATPCAFGVHGDGLAHLLDKQEWALVDVYFGRESEAGPWDSPTRDDIDLVTSSGGRVLFEFNIPAVRSRILLSRIPDLVRNGYWVTARDVPNATRYDVPELGVGFSRALQDSDVELYESLGGRVEHRLGLINALSGVLPNQSIPVLRDTPDVVYVQAGSVACLA